MLSDLLRSLLTLSSWVCLLLVGGRQISWSIHVKKLDVKHLFETSNKKLTTLFHVQGDLAHLESFQTLEVSWVFERQDYWEPRNCDGRFGVKWSRRVESVLRASPPREGHHSSENCGWCCTQGRHAPPSQSRGSDLHPPPHPALCSSQKFFVTTWTLLWVYVLHIIQNISTWVAITVAPPSCFFDSICLYLCVYVCVHVYTIWKEILKVKKCHHNRIEFTLETTQWLLHIHVKYCHDTISSLSSLY